VIPALGRGKKAYHRKLEKAQSRPERRQKKAQLKQKTTLLTEEKGYRKSLGILHDRLAREKGQTEKPKDGNNISRVGKGEGDPSLAMEKNSQCHVPS